MALLKSSATHIHSASGWKTICQLITNTALHPEASESAFDALALVVSSEVLSLASFQPCLTTAITIMERHSKVGCHPSFILPDSHILGLDSHAI